MTDINQKQPGPPADGGLPHEGGRRTARIPLPRSISNIVLIQSLSLLVPFFGCIEDFVISRWADFSPDADWKSWHPPLWAVLLAALIAGLWFALWRPALSGRRVAIIILYILYLLDVLIGVGLLLGSTIAAVYFVVVGMLEAAIVASVVIPLAIFFALLLLSNLLEKGVWEYAQLDGLCPQCGNWRFGCVRRAGTLKCRGCGADLEFYYTEGS
jgi:hypothetical protein